MSISWTVPINQIKLISVSILWLYSLGFLLFRNPWLSRIVRLLLRFLPPFLQFGHYRQGKKSLARLFCGAHHGYLRNKRTFTRYDVVVHVTLRENVHNLLVQPALQRLFRPLFPVLRSGSMPVSTNDSLAPFPLFQSWIGFGMKTLYVRSLLNQFRNNTQVLNQLPKDITHL